MVSEELVHSHAGMLWFQRFPGTAPGAGVHLPLERLVGSGLGCGRLGLGREAERGRGWLEVALLAAVCFAWLVRLAHGLKNVRLNLFLAFKCVKEKRNFIILFLSS